MGRPVVHFEITGRDAERLHTFYSELFDWRVNADNPFNYGTVDRESNVDAEGIGIGGGIGGTFEGQPGHVTVYVEVPDVEDGLSRAESLGGTRLMGPDQVTEGVEIGLFRDPEGNMIGLIKAQA